MPNQIALAKEYINVLDEVYKKASVTADLISDATMMRAEDKYVLYKMR